MGLMRLGTLRSRSASAVNELLQADALGHRRRRFRTHRHDAMPRASAPLHVMPIGSANDEGEGKARRLGQQAPLDALLAPIRRVRPSFFEPATSAFVIAPSIDSHDQSIPLSPSCFANPVRQSASNTPAFVHSRKLRYAELHEQMPVASSAIPLASDTQHEQNGVHGISIRHPRIVAPQRVRLAWRRERDESGQVVQAREFGDGRVIAYALGFLQS